MVAELIDGNAVASELLAGIRDDVARLTAGGMQPHLAAIRANNDAGSGWYAKAQGEHCAKNGIGYTLIEMGKKASEADILAEIQRLNQDKNISAILLHLPLPAGCEHLKLAAAIDPIKDAEGVHPQNLGALLTNGYSDPAPCTAVGAVELVRRLRPDLHGAKALVLGRSAIVGKPAALLLLNLNASVMIGHSRSDVSALCREADVIIAATGAASVVWNRYRRALQAFKDGAGAKPAIADLSPLVKADMIKEGAIIVDVGVNHIPTGLDASGEPLKNSKGRVAMQYVGDVDYEACRERAGFITSPKGGSGPVTNAYLLINTVNSAKKLSGMNIDA